MKMETLNAPVAEVPFKELFVSDINPRSVVDEDGIEALAENIKALGLIQNLAGIRREDGLVGIVAGGRRYRALALLQDDPRFQTVPVRVTDDEEVARYWASSENHLRAQPHPADEIKEYGSLHAEGVDPKNIAMAFGVTEAHVTRRLKLAHLPADVLAALKANEITLGNAAAFTITDDAKLALEVLAQVRGGGFSDQQIKGLLKPAAVKGSDRRVLFVGHDAYVEAGGRVSADLFAETNYYEDVDLLDQLFLEALREAAEAHVADGWLWADIEENSYIGYWQIEELKCARVYPVAGELTEEQSARHEELADLTEAGVIDAAGEDELECLEAFMAGSFTDAQKAVGGLLVYVSADGSLDTCAGLIRAEDKAAAVEAGVLTNYKAATPPAKQDISAKLREDLNKVVLGARQSAVVDNGDLLVALLAYQLSHSIHWDGALDVRAEFPSITPSTGTDGYEADTRLTERRAKDMWGKDLARSFRAFRAKGDEHIHTVLTECLAANLREGDGGLFDLITKENTPAIRKVWTPTAGNFFARVKGPYLNELWMTLLGLAEDHPTVTAFNKLTKKEKNAKLDDLFNNTEVRAAMDLNEEQIARIDAWLPEGME